MPHLRAGDVAVRDNARIHGVEGIREMVEAAGARLLPLPRYSMDLSPIEPAWAKIKHIVRKLRPEESSRLPPSRSELNRSRPAMRPGGSLTAATSAIPNEYRYSTLFHHFVELSSKSVASTEDGKQPSICSPGEVDSWYPKRRVLRAPPADKGDLGDGADQGASKSPDSKYSRFLPDEGEGDQKALGVNRETGRSIPKGIGAGEATPHEGGSERGEPRRPVQ